MESRQAKISDPNFVRLALARLDRFCSEQIPPFDPTSTTKKATTKMSTTSGTNAASGGIDAVDLLGYFYSEEDNDAKVTQLAANPPSRSSLPGNATAVSVERESALTDSLRDNWTRIEQPATIEDATLSEAAEILGLDRRSILGLITIGQLEADTDNRGQLMISGTSLHAYIQLNATKRVAEIPKPEPGTATFESPVPAPDQSPPAVVTEPPSQAAETTLQPSATPATPSSPPRMDVHELVAKLAEAQSQLESASYRIGFLEAELSTNEQKIKLLPDIQAQESRLAALERENLELHQRLQRLERSPFGFLGQLFSPFAASPPRRNLTQPTRGQTGPEHEQFYLHRKPRRDLY